MEAALITAAQIRTITGINADVNGPQRIEPQIIPTTRQYIRPLLGSALYEELTDAVEAAAAEDPTPLTAEQTALLEVLRLALANYIVFDVWPGLQVHVTQAGVVQQTGQQSTTADRAALSDARDRYRVNAERYRLDAERFLVENAADYPLYVVPVSTPTPGLLGGLYLG